MTQFRMEIAYRLLHKLVTYMRKEYTWRDSRTFFLLCEAMKDMETVYKIDDKEKERILK